jgi:predicted DNA-binding transcriptional regulator AlpA
MNQIPFKPRHSAITTAVKLALLIPATPTIQADGSFPKNLERSHAKEPKPIQCPDFDTMSNSGFVRLPTLLSLFACSRSTIWRWVKAGKIPAPKKLGPRVTAWNVAEIRQVISDHMSGVAA